MWPNKQNSKKSSVRVYEASTIALGERNIFIKACSKIKRLLIIAISGHQVAKFSYSFKVPAFYQTT